MNVIDWNKVLKPAEYTGECVLIRRGSCDMGIRMLQPQGLPELAIAFLKRNAVVLNQCPHCHRNDGFAREIIDSLDNIYFGDPLPLFRYKLTDGTVAEEFVQHESWDCGPMIWLGLKRKDANDTQLNVFKWDEGLFTR